MTSRRGTSPQFTAQEFPCAFMVAPPASRCPQSAEPSGALPGAIMAAGRTYVQSRLACGTPRAAGPSAPVAASWSPDFDYNNPRRIARTRSPGEEDRRARRPEDDAREGHVGGTSTRRPTSWEADRRGQEYRRACGLRMIFIDCPLA